MITAQREEASLRLAGNLVGLGAAAREHAPKPGRAAAPGYACESVVPARRSKSLRISASWIARLSHPSASTSARSTIVRATLVTGMQSATSRSALVRHRVVWTVKPDRASRVRGAVTSIPPNSAAAAPTGEPPTGGSALPRAHMRARPRARARAASVRGVRPRRPRGKAIGAGESARGGGSRSYRSRARRSVGDHTVLTRPERRDRGVQARPWPVFITVSAIETGHGGKVAGAGCRRGCERDDSALGGRKKALLDCLFRPQAPLGPRCDPLDERKGPPGHASRRRHHGVPQG